jgi:hypothetical protein
MTLGPQGHVLVQTGYASHQMLLLLLPLLQALHQRHALISPSSLPQTSMNSSSSPSRRCSA